MTRNQQIINFLKSTLQARDVTYAQLAKMLKVSEVTIKRIFSYKTTPTIDKIEELCNVLDLDLFEVIDQINNKNENTKPQHLNLIQEYALEKNPKLLVYFYALLANHSPSKIVEHYNISNLESQKYLIELDHLKLIFLEKNNKFKILAHPLVEWAENGPLSKKYEKDLRNDFLNFVELNKNEWFLFKKTYLTKESIRLIRKQQTELLAKIKEYSEFDRKMQIDRCEPITFLFSARQWIPTSILKYRR